jgi:hypothetical protein
MMATGKKMGRPTQYTDILVDEICGRLACGEPMAKITQSAHMPDPVTIYRWLREKPDFQQRYADARRDGAHCLADQIQDIVDTEPLAVFDEAGNKRYDAGSIAHNRLRMDARKWLAAKYLPKVYGDKTIVSGDDEAPLAVEVSFDVFGELLKNVALTRHTSE